MLKSISCICLKISSGICAPPVFFLPPPFPNHSFVIKEQSKSDLFVLLMLSLFLLKSVVFIKIEVVLLTIGAFLNLYLLMELFIWKQVENNKDSFSVLDDMLLSIFNRRMNDKPIDLRIKGTVKLLEQIVSVNFLIIIFFLIVIVSA